jgi:hypothetical protein
MPKNMWEEDEEELTMSEEEAEQALAEYEEAQEALAEYEAQENEEVVYEEAEQEISEEEEDAIDESIMADARLRLEQGRLYEMLLKHSLFEGVDADPRAIKNVEREIKRFIKSRLEILVGLKQEAPKAQVSVSPFTELEIDMLKQLLGRVLKKEPEQKVIAYTPPVLPKAEKPSPKPVQQQKPAPTIKPVVGSKAPVKPAQSAVKVVPKATKPVPKARPEVKASPKNEKPLEKSPYEMSSDELAELARVRSQKYVRATGGGNIKRTPMPDADSRASYIASLHMGETKSANGLDMGRILSHIGAQAGIQDVGDPSNDY